MIEVLWEGTKDPLSTDQDKLLSPEPFTCQLVMIACEVAYYRLFILYYTMASEKTRV